MIFTVEISEPLNAADGQAARMIVEEENERRAALEIPEPALPLSPDAELVGAYELVLEREVLPNAHASYVRQAADIAIKAQEINTRWEISDDNQREAAAAQLEPLPETS